MATAPTILPTKNGPYKVEGLDNLRNSRSEELDAKSTLWLCRCGGSKNKPSCDGTHWYIEFTDPRN